MHMAINWNPGKSEALLVYRGKNAVACREQWRQKDGSLSIAIPDSNLRVNVVGKYKHLGTMTCSDGDTYQNALIRTQSAMVAFSPLAIKLFGSERVTLRFRLCFMKSLILSKLLFNVHITVPSPRDIAAFNMVYMRVLRRIHGDVRYSQDTQFTDLQIRTILEQPSIDCILAKMRLRYAKRILTNRPRALIALLHVSISGRRLPWIDLLARDCDLLRSRVLHTDALPSLCSDPD